MSIARRNRADKRQLGQFLTPNRLSRKIVDYARPKITDLILEPSFGSGSFIESILDHFHDKNVSYKNAAKMIAGVEIDTALYQQALHTFHAKYGLSAKDFAGLSCDDYFRWGSDQATLLHPEKYFAKNLEKYDLVIGNPPFGGTFDKQIEDQLDRIYGFRLGEKIKKETYAFFIIKSIDLLKDLGRLVFICSDTFLTINTMKGLRKVLMDTGSVRIRSLKEFSDETSHPMVIIDYQKGPVASTVSVDGDEISVADIKQTPNYSWKINSELLKYFNGKLCGEYVVATSGMTVGKNEYFIKKIGNNNTIEERYEYELFQDPITLTKELQKARLGKLSEKRKQEIQLLESKGVTTTNVKVSLKAKPTTVQLPNKNYKYYNKGQTKRLYANPKYVIYWKDAGKAVYLFKYNGPWYLHGVGGKKYFEKEGITWQLVANKLYARYLPSGYILDSGSPAAFLRQGIEKDELYFILGWLATDIASDILKKVINHTRNIQGKDVERLPYPSWVSATDKKNAIKMIKKTIADLISGKNANIDPTVAKLNSLFRQS